MSHPMNIVAQANKIREEEGKDHLSFTEEEHIASVVAFCATVIMGAERKDVELLLNVLGVDPVLVMMTMANMFQFDMESQGRAVKDEMRGLIHEVTPEAIRKALEDGDSTELRRIVG